MDTLTALLQQSIMSVPNGADAAKRIWEGLDRLAETDPAGYETFIEQQMRETACTASRSSSKPDAMLTTANLSADGRNSPCTIVLCFFPSDACLQPRVPGNTLHSIDMDQVERLEIEFRVRWLWS